MQSGSYDVCVYGATPAGVAAAVRTARAGLRVALVTHTAYLGGMFNNGIGTLDTQYAGHRAPLLTEFWDRVLGDYATTHGRTSPQFEAVSANLTVEPHVAERVIGAMLAAESGIEVLTGQRVTAVERAESHLGAVIIQAFAGGRTRRLAAAAFVDASYEGDLAAMAGAPYRVGRESREEFGEPHAGRIFTRHRPHHAPTDGEDAVAFPREAQAGLLNLRPFDSVSTEIFAGSTGEGDAAVQAYNLRLILTSDPANRRPIPRPEGYDRSRYLGLLRSEAENTGTADPVKSHWLHRDVRTFRFGNWKHLPNGKVTWNHGNFPGQNHAYPRGDWPARAAIAQRHRDHELGLLWFLQNDPDVPADFRAYARDWGLAADEFPSNDNLPYEPYVREARRIVGRYVFTEHDASLAPGLRRAPIHTDAIAITEWPLDSHECTLERQYGSDYEGSFLLTEKTRPAQVPYRSLLPQGVDNLLVPTCLSCSHVGLGTVRVEPTWMHIGESAGVAVVLAARAQRPPAALDPDALLRALVEARVMVSFFNDVDLAGDAAWVPAVQYLGTRGFFESYDARPGELLDAPTAEIWARNAGAAWDGDDDVNRSARQLSGAPPDAGPVLAQRFADMLDREIRYRDAARPLAAVALDACAIAADGPLTRGDACRLIYHLGSAS